MNMHLHRGWTTTIIGVGLLLARGAALAGPLDSGSLDPSETVRFEDLNVSSPKGARILYDRIRDAARHVCERGGDWYPTHFFMVQHCVEATVDHVVAGLALPALTEVHQIRQRGLAGVPGLQARGH